MIEVIESGFSHVANAESGWYVRLRGSHDEVMGDVGKDAAEAEAVKAGWQPTGRAGAGWPSQYNLRQYERSYWFYGRALWRHHDPQCWCAHQFCQRNWDKDHKATCPKRATFYGEG